MTVVSNTSPITNLAAIGRLQVFEALYSEVHVPQAVWQELVGQGISWPGQDAVAASQWIKRHVVENEPLVKTLRRDLDAGEAEAIALAVELQANLLLLDEKQGRLSAQRLELPITGVVGVLLEAKRAGLLDRIEPCLRELRETAGFYLSQSVYEAALREAGERP